MSNTQPYHNHLIDERKNIAQNLTQKAKQIRYASQSTQTLPRVTTRQLAQGRSYWTGEKDKAQTQPGLQVALGSEEYAQGNDQETRGKALLEWVLELCWVGG